MARAVALVALLTLPLSGCAEVPAARTNGADMTPTDSLERVVSRTFTVSSFKLEGGRVLPELTLAYESYGQVAVAGPSYGGYQSFQWAVTYPTFMSGVVPVVTAPKGSGGEAAVKSLVDRLATDPNWNGGWHYERGGVFPTLLQMRIETLERYGQNEILARTISDPAALAARIRELAETWARQFDPNSMVTLRKAAVKFDAERDFPRVRAKVLYVLSRTDKLFPPSIAPAVMDKLSRAGIDAKYFEIDTEFGHSASGPEWAKWAPTLKDFLAKLEQ